MPGLVGIIGRKAPSTHRDELQRMVSCMYKRNAFASGTYIDEKHHVYVGWTSHPGSYSDCLPVRDPAGDAVLFFAGEHSRPDGGDEERLSREVRCSPDRAEVLLPLYLEKGDGFFPHLNGFFHGLIVDSRQGKVILFNDRFGMQRLYIYEEPDAFYFASEAKSILSIRAELRKFDLRSLGEWLSCGAVLESRSLFRRISVLPGASLWNWHHEAALNKRAYFVPEEWGCQPQLKPEDFYNKLRSTFVKRLPIYLRFNNRIGMSVTGGLDTRMILANLGTAKNRVHCYSFDGPYRENLDVSIGRRIALAQGLDHTTIRITEGFFKCFSQLAEDVVMSTDGNLDMSGTANMFVSQFAQVISPIRLTGNYGSEILRRHRAFYPSKLACRVLHPEWAAAVENAAISWKALHQGHPLDFVVFKQIPWFSFNRLQAEQSLLTMRSPFMDNDLLKVIYQGPDSCTRSNEMSLRLIHDGDSKLGEVITDRGVTYPKQPNWLWMRAYYEFVFKMEYYASHGMPRLAASIDRRLGPLSLERLFLGKNKYYHLRQWLRDELGTYVRTLMLDERSLSREYLNRDEMTRAIKAHLAGTENHTYSINMLLALELTNRQILGES